MAECYARDGLVARDTGPWAQDKLDHLTRYADLMTRAMKNKWPLVFVDLMAGPGRCIDTRSPVRQEFDGSTLLALDPALPFKRVLSVEMKPLYAEALRARVGNLARAPRCTVMESDCNSPEVVRAIRAATNQSLTLMFVDLIGTEVEMRTLQGLTKDRAVDLVITWPVMDLNRNRGMLMDDSERWTLFFGTDQWKALAARVGPHRVVPVLQRFYIRQLEQLGYIHHRVLRGVKNRRGGVLYRQMFASKNRLGLHFWDTTSAIHARKNPQFDW